MTSKADSSTSPRKPPLRVGAACSRPCQRSCAGTCTSPGAATPALRLAVLWPSIRSRAVSGCSTSAGPPAMRSSTTSWPGTAVTRTVSPPAPPLRRVDTRTDSLTRPFSPLAACMPAPPLRLAWRWPGTMKVMASLADEGGGWVAIRCCSWRLAGAVRAGWRASTQSGRRSSRGLWIRCCRPRGAGLRAARGRAGRRLKLRPAVLLPSPARRGSRRA